jgi:hypothetical protein
MSQGTSATSQQYPFSFYLLGAFELGASCANHPCHLEPVDAPTAMLSVLVMLNMKGPNTSTTHFDPLARQTEPEMLHTSHSLCFIVLVGLSGR